MGGRGSGGKREGAGRRPESKHPAQVGLLEDLLAAAARYVAASARADSVTTTVRIYLSPFRVDVAHRDRDGQIRIFRSDGDPALAELTATFLNGGVGALPADQRRSTLARVGREAAELLVMVDVAAGAAGGVLLPAGDDEEPRLLFTLRHEETLH